MNPGLWLEDYRLACQAGSTEDDYFIIRNLRLFLAIMVVTTRTWLEHIPSDRIQRWSDLKEVFMGNFQVPWELQAKAR
jgi:hypothetical protein